MTVNRVRPLPCGILCGRFRISPGLIHETRQALQRFFESGRHEGGHEGLCYWAGREKAGVTRQTGDRPKSRRSTSAEAS